MWSHSYIDIIINSFWTEPPERGFCPVFGTTASVYFRQKVKPKGVFRMYEFRNVRGHVEVYDNRGRFLFSADNEREALEELELTA